MIDPKFWQSEKVGKMSMQQRLMLLGLVSNADDVGRLIGAPAFIRSTIFTYDDIPVSDIIHDLAVIEAAGVILRYRVENQDYIQLRNWTKYQTINRPQPSLLPSPQSVKRVNDSVNGSVNGSVNDSRPEEVKGKEVKGKEEPESKKTLDDKNGRYISLVNLLRDHIIVFRKSKRFTAKWFEDQHREIRLLIEKDGSDCEEVGRVLRWLPTAPIRKNKDGQEFTWRTIIGSAESLRKNFDKMAPEASLATSGGEKQTDAQRFADLVDKGKGDGPTSSPTGAE